MIKVPVVMPKTQREAALPHPRELEEQVGDAAGQSGAKDPKIRHQSPKNMDTHIQRPLQTQTTVSPPATMGTHSLLFLYIASSRRSSPRGRPGKRYDQSSTPRAARAARSRQVVMPTGMPMDTHSHAASAQVFLLAAAQTLREASWY